MNPLTYIPVSEIRRVRQALSQTSPQEACAILSDLFRINTLYMIARAGSGHIGSSFSCLDILTWLWQQEMNDPNQRASGDLCFSSKGHDAPGLYALMIGMEKLDSKYLHLLRQLGGLPGHPDVKTPYIVTNTGSLGMGISKARGMVTADRLNGVKRQIYVITGDGELQEGQFWESLQPTANGHFSEITVIVDHNKIQSDLWVKNVSDLGHLEEKLRAFNWEVRRCDGHDFEALGQAFSHFKTIQDRPQILIADTLKGKGVSFMEPHQLGEFDLYGFHSGAPSVSDYENALAELLQRVNQRLQAAHIDAVQVETVERPVRLAPQSPQKLVKAYGEALVELARENPDIVALDGDLMLDTGLIPFKNEFPQRFVECGIAEQDMVSMAGGLALQGKIPVVHSFACFLSTRPNEQIYNNATEHTKIIYAGSLAGVVPSGPGHSHQSVRDISILGSIPGLTLIEPANEQESKMSIRWAVAENTHSTYIRLVSIPVDTNFELPADYRLTQGQGVALCEGNDAVLFAYGPVMLTEALKASQQLKAEGISLKVVNLPWLNTVDPDWLQAMVQPVRMIFTLDNHYRTFGQGMVIGASLMRHSSHKPVISFGLDQVPACGLNHEVLAHHELDANGLTRTIHQHLASVLTAPA
ncbi:transketolase C-terminal domain-containing protein [Vampirovibrio sp.]|uniref:transketolase family protein n=1 Tax=Vampirovibrio sp. TaxID=2717857 RepID=UPI0035935D53